MKTIRVLGTIDVQNDFRNPKGGLYVNGAEKNTQNIINALNSDYDYRFVTLDYHPVGHVSFASTHGEPLFEMVDTQYGKQICWPDHCVQGTWGAEIDKDVEEGYTNWENVQVIYKGTDINIDSYSGLKDNRPDGECTALLAYLTNIVEQNPDAEIIVDLVGDAFDYCVSWTGKDIKAQFPKFTVRIIKNCCASVSPDNDADVIADLAAQNVQVI